MNIQSFFYKKITLFTVAILLIFPAFKAISQESSHHAELILPFQAEHVHGSTVVELPNGDLLASWFQGSGERWADDVQIMGARKEAGSDEWSEPFLMADVAGFPDINPVLFIDGKDRLWLTWYTVIANQWETSVLKARYSNDYMRMQDAPNWEWQEDIHVKPGDKAEWGIQPGDSFVESVKRQVKAYRDYLGESGAEQSVIEDWNERGEELIHKAGGQDFVKGGRLVDQGYEGADLGYPYFRRMGWQTRSKPHITDSGRLILPLYSDGFSFSMMAYTDNWGETWEFSEPIVGFKNLQPTIAETESGELVAYMRDSGPEPKRLMVTRSTDNGKTWSTPKDTKFPNPSSAADIVTLENGHWVMLYNDSVDERHSLAVALSEDGGKTWPWVRKLEYNKHNPSSVYAAYPAVIVGEDGNLHASYSFRRPLSEQPEKETIKYAVFNEAWIKGD